MGSRRKIVNASRRWLYGRPDKSNKKNAKTAVLLWGECYGLNAAPMCRNIDQHTQCLCNSLTVKFDCEFSEAKTECTLFHWVVTRRRQSDHERKNVVTLVHFVFRWSSSVVLLQLIGGSRAIPGQLVASIVGGLIRWWCKYKNNYIHVSCG